MAMNTIRTRALLAIVIVGFVPLFILFLTTHTVISAAIARSEAEKLREITVELARHVGEIMDSAASDLESLRTNPVLSNVDADPSARLGEMKRLVNVYGAFSDISLYDRFGYLVDSTTAEEPVWRDYSQWFESALGGETAISDPLPVPGENGLRLNVYLPLHNRDEEVSEVVVARLSFGRVIDLLNGVDLSGEGQMVLLDSRGRLISHFDESHLREPFDARLEVVYWEENKAGHYEDPFGVSFLFHAQHMLPQQTRVGSSWYLLALKPMEEVQAILRQTEYFLVFGLLATLLVAAWMAILFARMLSRPLVSASRAAGEVAHGNLAARIDPSGPDEIRALAEAFNAMVAELKGHRDRLESLVESRTARLRDSQARLSATTAQLRAAFESTKEAMLLVGADGSVIATNHLFCEFFGIEETEVESARLEALQELAVQTVGEKQSKVLWGEAALDSHEVMDWEISVDRPVSRRLAVYSSPVYAEDEPNEVVGRLWSWQDMTEQRSLEESLRHSQKMEAIGQLAGGVAHDFNNLLTGILGNLSLAEMDLKEAGMERPLDYVRMASGAGRRAAELVKQLLGFSRRTQLDLRAIDANEVLEGVRKLLSASIGAGIEIDLQREPSAWPVLVDGTQLEQVVMNICVNAKDAIVGEGGTIRLRCDNRVVTEEECLNHVDGKPGEFLCISVEDNGHGMPPAIMKRIFEPFFTTKEQGKGTGLGLATSFGIIKQHGGWIACKSEVGKGTRFEIFLPRTDVQLPSGEEEEAELSTALPQACSETVLLVDDEVIVRRVAETLLSKLGYQTMVASDGQEGLEVFREHADEIDLIMLDLTMPRLSGKDAFKLIRHEYPDMPVLICSGYLVDLEAFAEETGSRPDGFVQKPYRMETLTDTVRTVIDQWRQRNGGSRKKNRRTVSTPW